MTKPSVILLGAKPGSLVALSTMLERGWDIRHVVTSVRFDYPWLPKPSLRAFAAERGVSVLESQEELPREPVDFVISYMFRYLVKPETLALARRGALNFHAAPLPEFAGWAFYNLAILENASEYGCSCHFMDEGFDTGPLVKVRRFRIDAAAETAYSLEARAQKEMVRLFCEFCRMAESGDELPREPQDPKRMRYLTLKQLEALKEVPPNADDETMQRHARAFWYPPYEGAFLRVGALKAEIVPRAVKEHLGAVLHAGDFNTLQEVARDYWRD
jgi:methionyl-tRNA formyltransferase